MNSQGDVLWTYHAYYLQKSAPPQLKLTVLAPPERHALLHRRRGRILTWCSHDSHLLLTLHLFSTLFSPFLLILTFFLTICSPSYQLIPTFSADSHLMFNLFSPHRILTLCLPYFHIVLTHSVLILTLFSLDVHLLLIFFPAFFLALCSRDYPPILTWFLCHSHLILT